MTNEEKLSDILKTIKEIETIKAPDNIGYLYKESRHVFRYPTEFSNFVENSVDELADKLNKHLILITKGV